jgi:hypothetical protein
MHWYFDGVATLRRERYVVPARFLEDAEEMLATAEASGNPGLIIQTQWGWGGALMLRGDFEEAEEHLRAGLALAERTGHLIYQTWFLTWLSVLHRRCGDAGATRECASRGLRVATSAGLLENAAMACGNLSWFAWREGDLAGAEKQARAALELWGQSAFVYAFHWTARFPLLAMALSREQIPEALNHARALLDPQQQKLPDPLEAALEAAIQAGEEEGAKAATQHLEHAIQIAKEMGFL